MSSTTIDYKRGDTICRPTDWIDILKFIVLNYGLHAMTVVTLPGTTWWRITVRAIGSAAIPSFGILFPYELICRFPVGGDSDLEIALRAGALCMLVPTTLTNQSNIFKRVIPGTAVHGYYPVSSTRDVEKSLSGQEGCTLVRVPRWFTVEPFGNSSRKISNQSRWERFTTKIKTFFKRAAKVATGQYPNGVIDPITEPRVASSYSLLKPVAALLQVLYGSFDLYRARGNQLERYGYAAYSLTVIPYILMSIVNLLANLTGPSYPSMFLVHYLGHNNGTVGTTTAPSATPPTLIPGHEQDKQATETIRISTSNDPQSHDIAASNEKLHQRLEVTGIEEPKYPTDDMRDRKQERIYPDGWWTEAEREVVEGMTIGTVGRVYGDFRNGPRGTLYPSEIRWFLLPWACSIALPYIVMGLLTGFRDGHSTRSQRSWIMSWLVMGQIGPVLLILILNVAFRWLGIMPNTTSDRYIQRGFLLIPSAVAIGGLVAVAQMIAADKVCYRI